MRKSGKIMENYIIKFLITFNKKITLKYNKIKIYKAAKGDTKTIENK